MGNIIAMWSGVNDIPNNWVLCNGENGTPNLIDKFIKQGTPGTHGGSLNHTHSISSGGGSHSHSVSFGGLHRHAQGSSSGRFERNGDKYTSYESHDHPSTISSGVSHNHSTNQVSNLPSYYALAYIMGGDDFLGFPIGTIVMFTGYVAPKGWAFCDGANGTPDLRNKFVKCASDDNDANKKGGTESHTHTLVRAYESHTHGTTSSSSSHSHNRGSGGYTDLWSNDVNGRITDSQGPTHSHTAASSGSHTHSVSSANNIPPFYSLSFIQRIF